MSYEQELDKQFMQEAISLAIKGMNQNDGGPFGAVVVKDGKIIGRGNNCVTSTNDPTAHAEVVAIKDACKNLKNFQLDGCVIYSSCEPCPMCLAACQQARIRSVIYGAKDPKGGALSLGYRLHEDQRTNHRFLVEYQEVEACSKILSEFFAKKRRE